MPEPRALPYDWKDVRQRLQREVPRLLRRLKIDAPVRGGRCLPLNPRRADRRAGSFVIWCEGDGAGAWKDYAIDLGGDVFQLIGYLEGLARPIDCYWWALEFLGLGRGEVRSAETAALDRQRAADDAKAAAAKREGAEEAKGAALAAWWYGKPSAEAGAPVGLAPGCVAIAGTLAERYLVEGRGIDLARIRTPGALRYCARLENIDQRTGEVTYWPAMVAAMTRGKRVTGLHRTWLRPDGLGKAEIDFPKLTIGSCKGAAIRLTRGPSGLSPSKAAEAGRLDPLALGEGIETTLSVAVARPDYRCWAAWSLSNMGAIDWPACASAAVLLRDNDLSPQAIAAFVKAEAHWRAQAHGRPVVPVASDVGKDFNEWRAA